MEREGEEIHVTPEEARAGRKGSRLLTMLIVSTLLAIGLLTIAWVTGALTSTDGTPNPRAVPTSAET